MPLPHTSVEGGGPYTRLRDIIWVYGGYLGIVQGLGVAIFFPKNREANGNEGGE